MKRLFINAALMLGLAGTFSACKKQIDADYLNPEKTTVGSLSKLLSGMYANTRIHPSYQDYFTYKSTITGVFGGLIAVDQGQGMYLPNVEYIQRRWIDFYAGTTGNDYNYNGPGIMANYAEMKTTFAGLSATDQADQLIFLKCAQVIVCDQAAQMVDVFGDIPFFNTNSLNSANRDLQLSQFDDAKTIYDTLISNLKDLNTYFDTVKVSPVSTSALQTQDILLKGSIDGWRRYTNSLRMRLLMRISNQNETFAKQEMTTMLSDPTTYPVITDNSQNVMLQGMKATDNLRSDMTSDFNANNGVPTSFLLDTVMLMNNDPRTPFFWSKYNGAYVSYKTDLSNGSLSAKTFSVIDSTTIQQNYNVPGVVITASEVSFAQAEAQERWGLGDASVAYAKGIQQSVDFWYNIYATRVAANNYAGVSKAQPTTTDVANYMAKPAVAYTGTQQQKIAKIITQKWEHFFILQATEAWSEYRRTGYPAQHFVNSINTNALQPANRLTYPDNEKTFNPENYAKVAPNDTRDKKIFWDVN